MSSFDPSVLDNKDRDQLSQIAEQLGKKPPARAKKADIVALILELAGVSPAAEPEAAEVEAEAPAAAEAGAPDAGAEPEPEADAAPARRGGGRAGAPAAGTEAGTDEDDDTPARPEPARSGPAPDRGRPAQPDRNGGQGGGQSRPPQPQGGARPAQNQNGSGQGNQSNQPQGQQNRGPQEGNGNGNGNGNQNRNPQDANQRPAAPAGEDAESGNRRRRRRGRGGQEQVQEDGFQGEPVEVEGLLDLREEGYGFLRLKGYLPSNDDVYVSVKQARQFALRKGDRITGKSRPALRNEKNPALLQIDLVNGGDPEEMKERVRFEDLTPLFPDSRLELEIADEPGDMTARIIDLVAPIGKGQRGLIVSPPKAGKTAVMKHIAKSIETNHPEVELIVLLVDERPEEVTDMKRSLTRGEVAASTFDRPAEEHTHVAELVIERAKRLVEEGKDVVIILDGITRLARAYNLAAPPTGRIMSGGIDTGALYPPKKFFGAARNVEEGGSLTILATALVETGSRMDEVIFEEFKGTGNMELKLDRRLADRRIFPAIDVEASSTRREELLFDPKQLEQVWKLRKVLAGLKDDGAGNAAGLELLMDRMKSFRSNNAFLAEIGKAPTA